MTLLSYLVHSDHKYKLIQESDSSLKIVVENQSGQQAEATVNNVDCASFRPQLEPLSKSNTAQLVLTYKPSSRQTKTVVYSYSSSGTPSLTEIGSGYQHQGTLKSIGVCGPTNREKLCAVYENSGLKFQLLNVNSSSGAITASGSQKTLTGASASSITAVSAAEGGSSRIVVLLSENTTLKKGDGTGNTISLSNFSTTALSGKSITRIAVNACKNNKVCAIVQTSENKLYYIKAQGNSLSSSSVQELATVSGITDMKVVPTYSGATVSSFNVFLTKEDGSVEKVSFNVGSTHCGKQGQVTTTTEITPSTTSTTALTSSTTTSIISSTTSALTSGSTTTSSKGGSRLTLSTTTSRTSTSRNSNARVVSSTSRSTTTKKNTTKATSTSTQNPASPPGTHPKTIPRRSTISPATASSSIDLLSRPSVQSSTYYPHYDNQTTSMPHNLISGNAGATAAIVIATLLLGVLLITFIVLVVLVCKKRRRARQMLQRYELALLQGDPTEERYEDGSDEETPSSSSDITLIQFNNGPTRESRDL